MTRSYPRHASRVYDVAGWHSQSRTLLLLEAAMMIQRVRRQLPRGAEDS